MVLIYEYIHTPLSGVFFMEKENRYNRLWEPILGKFPTGLLNRDAEINSRYAKRLHNAGMVIYRKVWNMLICQIIIVIY